MDIEQLYRDYNVDFVTEGHKHARAGWVNTECPFCEGNKGYHLGFDTHDEKFVCWRCGGKFAPQAISYVLNVNMFKARELLQQYGALAYKGKKKANKNKVPFKLPSNNTPVTVAHKKYLKRRRFDADKIIEKYKLQSTSIFSILKKSDGTVINYKHRILIPYFNNGVMCSFDARDITGKSEMKYMGCPEEYEETARKDILYGLGFCTGNTGLCVEGTTDVWRMGDGAFATSGIKYTSKQVRLIAKTFKRVAVLYDDDPQAVIQAEKLVGELRFRGVDAFRVVIKGDPGGMSQKEADKLKKQLL